MSGDLELRDMAPEQLRLVVERDNFRFTKEMVRNLFEETINGFTGPIFEDLNFPLYIATCPGGLENAPADTDTRDFKTKLALFWALCLSEPDLLHNLHIFIPFRGRREMPARIWKLISSQFENDPDIYASVAAFQLIQAALLAVMWQEIEGKSPANPAKKG